MNSIRCLAISLSVAGALFASAITAQIPMASNHIELRHTDSASALRFVVVISRHGVRSPTGKVDQFNQYSSQPWPKWSVPPGYLTEHGAKLMTLFGAYDRELYASQGLLSRSGCDDVAGVTIVTDSDQRTRETGKALAAGLLPNCLVDVHALADGAHDPLFHFSARSGDQDGLLATAALSGRIGNNPGGLVDAYRTQLQEMEAVLTGCDKGLNCGKSDATTSKSLFDIASTIEPGSGDHLVEVHSPLGTASTMAENFLLEYAEGMEMSQVGWGRVDRIKLNELMNLHTGSSDIERRTGFIARVQSSDMLAHVADSIEQAIMQRPVPGALSKPADRLLLVVGHDTNLSNIAGALNLSWLIDGRRDDTPPGGALVFEVRQQTGTPAYTIDAYYTAQTLDQMRESAALSLNKPPAKANVFIPGCSKADPAYSCDWANFKKVVDASVISTFVQ